MAVGMNVNAALAVASLVVLATCAPLVAGAGVRGGMRTGAVPGVVALHNPANDMDVFSVFVESDARVETPSAGGFRALATSIVAAMTVQPAAEGVSVLSGGWAENEVARAAFNDTIDAYGWAFLAIATNPDMPNSHQAVAAGYLEGQLTQHRIYQYALNGDAVKPFGARKVQFLREYEAWMDSQPQNTTYWQQAKLLNLQNVAMELAYNATAPAGEMLQDMAVMAMSWANDLATVEAAFAQQGVGGNDAGLKADHCSGFVRVTPNNQDIYFGHDTWSSFQSMMRLYKLYDFPYRGADDITIPGTRIVFSSYPATLYSGDDFYLTSAGLAVMETTIGTFNKSSLALINPSTMPTWQRTMMANRLAASGGEWAATFEPFNSGTYNNQFMVLNYNLFSPGAPLRDGTFTVVEQIPGLMQSGDLTDKLRMHGYFGSYNVPQFAAVVRASLVDEMVKEHGDWFSYKWTARAQIFRRNASSVNSLQDMQAMMRYNNFEHDPLSHCNCTPNAFTSENAIACRDDLNPADMTYPPGMGQYFGRRDHCAVDSKFTSYNLFMGSEGMQARIISSPTYDQQPVFVWSESWLNSVSHVGLPDRWEFPWIQASWMNPQQ